MSPAGEGQGSLPSGPRRQPADRCLGAARGRGGRSPGTSRLQSPRRERSGSARPPAATGAGVDELFLDVRPGELAPRVLSPRRGCLQKRPVASLV